MVQELGTWIAWHDRGDRSELEEFSHGHGRPEGENPDPLFCTQNERIWAHLQQA
jgi:hypothetical protein